MFLVVTVCVCLCEFECMCVHTSLCVYVQSLLQGAVPVPAAPHGTQAEAQPHQGRTRLLVSPPHQETQQELGLCHRGSRPGQAETTPVSAPITEDHFTCWELQRSASWEWK